MYDCFHCGGEGTLVWDSDYNGDEYGEEDIDLVQVLHCTDCGAIVEYKIPKEKKEED